MRLAVIAPPRFPIREPFGGGLEAQVWHLCAALRAASVEVAVYGAAGSDFAAADLSFPAPDWRGSADPASDITLPPHTARAHDRLMHELMDLLATNAPGYDLVHNHSLYPHPLARAAELPIPMVTTLHTPPFRELTDVLTARSGRFVAVSEFVRDAWAMVEPSPHVIHNGIDISRWMLGLGGDELGWFGRIVPEKAPHLAIAAARAAGRRLVIAGRVGDAAYFEREIAPHLSDQVRYLGELHQDELASVIGRCGAVLVTPVWPEPFGLVAVEAGACGTPVIAHAVGGLREAVTHGTNGLLVDAEDPAAMASAVPAALRLDRARVREHVVERFGVQTMTEQYLRLYRELLTVIAP